MELLLLHKRKGEEKKRESKVWQVSDVVFNFAGEE